MVRKRRVPATYYLSRQDGGETLYLYGWNDTQSAWGPDRAEAHLFPNPAAAMDMAVRCGGPVDSQISVVEA